MSVGKNSGWKCGSDPFLLKWTPFSGHGVFFGASDDLGMQLQVERAQVQRFDERLATQVDS